MKKDIFKRFTPQLFISLQTYNKEKFTKDLMGGFIVGIVALPMALAFGIASGVSPEKGLITAIVAGFIFSLLGGSTVQIAGPTGAFILIVYNAIQSYGTEGLVIVTVMSALIILVMGFLKLGVVIKFIPYPIIVGYMAGIAVIIFSTQFKDFLGLTIDETIPPDFIGKWTIYLKYIHTIDYTTFIIGILSLLIIVFAGKISRKIPGLLLTVVIITILVYILKNYFDVTTVATIEDLYKNADSNIEVAGKSLPFIRLVNELFPIAFTLAILGSIETLVSASVADGVTGERNNSNQELIAHGIANLVMPFFGGLPATGAVARTMTNVNSGGNTPVSGIVHSLFLLIVMLFLGSLTKHIPIVCLTAILIVVAYNISEWRSFVELLRNSAADIAVLLTTFLLTLIFDLTVALITALVLAIFLFLKRTNEVSKVSVVRGKLDLSNDWEPGDEKEVLTLPKGVDVYEIDGPFFFGMANKFEESMRVVGDKAKVRILRMRKVPFMDSTGTHNLESLCEKSKRAGIQIILSGVRPRVHDMIKKSTIPVMIGEENICAHIHLALDRAFIVLAEQEEKEKEKDKE